MGRLSLIFLILISLSACNGSRQSNYYKSSIDVTTAENLIPLSEGEKPEIIFSKNIDADKEKYQGLGYVILGESEFENREKYRAIRRTRDSNVARAVGQAMNVSATHVLYLRKKVGEYSTTSYKSDGGYDTKHYEKYLNRAVYMVRGRAN
ncbi:MAG: hypothetical protein P8H03_03785 [Emcibacteraceae bacterium]|nr:hypothetical protein [Emcibacteraceae bacterium]MDG1859201.1 hypothetical protein [Emcibacteraceae bacterium]